MSAVTTSDRLVPRLWVYTNFDCNLNCSYCVARSNPRAERRGIGLHQFKQLVDEAAAYGITELFLTGGEPFLLPDIAEKIRYAAPRIRTTVLTNAMLFRGRRLVLLDELRDIAVTMQVSIDGADAATHNAYRGPGAWEKAVEGIGILAQRGFTIAIGSTETTANAGKLDDLRAFVAGLGVPEERHFIRPLAKRGFSDEGLDLGASDLEPEVTVTIDGVYWHPLACEDDLLVSRRVFPFATAMATLNSMYAQVLESGAVPRTFR